MTAKVFAEVTADRKRSAVPAGLLVRSESELDDELLVVRWKRSERNVGDHWDAVFPGVDAADPARDGQARAGRT